MLRKFNFYYLILAALVDLTAVTLGLIFAYFLRAEGTDLYYWPIVTYWRLVAYSLPVWLIIFANQGLYNLRTLPSGWNAFSRALIGLFSGWGLAIVGLYLWKSPEAQAFPRLIILYGLLFSSLFLGVGRLALTVILRVCYLCGLGVCNLALLSKNGASLINELSHSRTNGLRLVGIIRSDHLNQLKKLHSETPLAQILVADPDLGEKKLLEMIDWCENHQISFGLVPSIFSVRSTNVDAGTLGGVPVMYFLRSPLETWGRVYKRALDLLLCAPAIILLSPIYLLFLILVPLSSRGSAIYRQPRVGQDGSLFFVHKFRSMYLEDERKTKHDWSGDESTDSRITPLGHFMRRTYIDELPQLWDIFLGKMSLVGPRPEQPKYVEKFSHEIPEYLRRHYVKTGLTGWAQVNGLRGDTSISERIKYDLYYIENWSIWFDLRIIFATLLMFGRQLLSGGKKPSL